MNIFTDPEAERAMLGCLLHSPDVLDDLNLLAEHFVSPNCRHVFHVIQRLHREGEQPTIYSVQAALNSTGDEPSDLVGIELVPGGVAPLYEDRLNRCLIMRRTADLVQNVQLSLPGCHTLEETRALAVDLAGKAAVLMPESNGEELLETVVRSLEAKLAAMGRGELRSGYQTQLATWNKVFGGIADGQMFVVAGRPGTGKTALMEQIVADYITAGVDALVFEKDMAPEKMVARLVCREAKIPFWRFFRGKLNESDRRLMNEWLTTILDTRKLHLYSPSGLTVERMLAITRREMRQHGVKVAFLDHITALQVMGDYREGLTRASLAIRNFVTETGLPFVILAHLNRDADKGRPSASHIKEFDQLFGDSDAVLLLWDKEKRDADIRPIEWLVDKNRDGATTEDTVLFDGPLMKFTNDPP